ncbi:PH domain-containing protein [Streptomyces sp. NPDC056231]|uniref:PH domain-containing protein n=1 Tax=Streptomyces sp. NPDC056231 TaxID=3345755 RepID=UPI003AAB3C1A
MQRVEYRASQRNTWWLWFAGVVALSAYSIVALATGWSRETDIGAFLSAFGLMGIPAAPWLAGMALGRTIVDAHGIQTRRLLGRSAAAWHEISEIKVDKVGGYHGNYDYWIRISRHDGDSFRLPAPMTSDVGRDPSFEAVLKKITHQWKEATRP